MTGPERLNLAAQFSPARLSSSMAEAMLTEEQNRLSESEWIEAKRVAAEFPSYFGGWA